MGGVRADGLMLEADVVAYAALTAELCGRAEARADILARHGLDEGRWEVLDTVWQQRLSEAMDVQDDGVPALFAQFANAYADTQRALATPITLEQFAAVTRRLSITGDIGAALASEGIELADYLRGSESWCQRIATDPAVEQTFQRALAGTD